MSWKSKRSKHSNAYASWGNEEMAELLYLKNKGKNDEEVAVTLGRSLNAIVKRLEYINSYKMNSHRKGVVLGMVKKLKEQTVEINTKRIDSELYAIGNIASTGICLQKKAHTEKEVLDKLVYSTEQQVIYKLVEVKVYQKLVVK